MRFAEALRAEGVPVFQGYVPLNRNQAVRRRDRHARWARARRLPGNAERAEADEVLMFSMPILLGTHEDIDDVVAAVAKVAAVRA